MSENFAEEMASLESEMRAQVPCAVFSVRFLPADRTPIIVDIRAPCTGFLGKLGLKERISTGSDQHEYAVALRRAIDAIPETKKARPA